MREPLIADSSDLDALPERPAVFLVWPKEGRPYLVRTALLRRRLKRLLRQPERVSSVLSLGGVVDRVEYWLTGSQIESALLHLELAQRHFPEDWPRLTRLRPPAFVRLTLDNPFPRTMVTTRLGRGLFFGPFAGRGAAERFDAELLDLFQIRRCEENLAPSSGHPGCIYGEMNRCLRPCQQVVTIEEYRSETARVEQFLRTNGSSLVEAAESARDRASMEMHFEEADRLHQRITRIEEVRAAAGGLARVLERLAGVAVVPSAHLEAVELWFMAGACWQPSRRLLLTETAGAGRSMDQRLREIIAGVTPEGSPNAEHLAILLRWYQSSWRDGEWLSFDSFDKIPYRKLVNLIGRIGAGGHGGTSRNGALELKQR
jgi:excinuclease UvrABC nuclease subunit